MHTDGAVFARELYGGETSAGGEFFLESCLQEPVRLLALRHEIAETLESLVRQIPPLKSQRQ